MENLLKVELLELLLLLLGGLQAGPVCTVPGEPLLLARPQPPLAPLCPGRLGQPEGVGHVVLLLLPPSGLLLGAAAHTTPLLVTVWFVLCKDACQSSLLCVQARHFSFQTGILNLDNFAFGHKNDGLLFLLVPALRCGDFVPLASSSSSLFILWSKILKSCGQQ